MNNTLTLAIIGHLVGDYLLQNDWMALNKKKWFFPLSIHCWLWSVSVMLFTGWEWNPGWRPAIVFTVLFLTHLIQDGTDLIPRWMKLIGQNQFLIGPCAPWSCIVVDNVWHIVTLWAVWRWLA
jgi:hypothetical protein